MAEAVINLTTVRPKNGANPFVTAQDISIKGVDLFYGDAQALKNIDLFIERNKVTALIGPSGCGKSTLLRCLNRMNDEIKDAPSMAALRSAIPICTARSTSTCCVRT